METQRSKREVKPQKKIFDIFAKSMINKKIYLPITTIGSGLKSTLELKVSNDIEGKCIVEGFVRPNSSKIITYSSGKITNGSFVLFNVVIECDICYPVEGMIIECKAKNITKAGIRAEVNDEDSVPVVIFIARDHHYKDDTFSTISEGDKLNVRVIGQRFELNDKYISVIAELSDTKKPKLVFKNDD